MSLLTYKGYAAYLLRAKELSTITSFQEWDGERSIILRHDVDLSLEPAFELSKIEAECGVRSTYFFLVSSPYYNVLSMKGRQILKKMSDQGFEIGLHFDPLLYPDYSLEKLSEACLTESKVLSEASGAPCKSVSIHNPTSHGQYPMFESFINAYDPTIFSPEYYLSDSCMNFRWDPNAFLEKAKKHTMQLLIHPLHVNEQKIDYPEIFARYYKHSITEAEKDFSKVNPCFKSQLGEGISAHIAKS